MTAFAPSFNAKNNDYFKSRSSQRFDMPKQQQQQQKQKQSTNGIEFSDTSCFSNDDWSKESLDQFFSPFESFLDYQRRREKSSKRRCTELVKVRTLENYQNELKNRLKYYDEKINLNLLLKMNKKLQRIGGKLPTLSNESHNFRLLVAQGLAKQKNACDRCKEKNKKFEENSFDRINNLFAHIKLNNQRPGEKKEEEQQQRGMSGISNIKQSDFNLAKLPPLAGVGSDMKISARRQPSLGEHYSEKSLYGQFESKTLNDFGESYFRKNEICRVEAESLLTVNSSAVDLLAESENSKMLNGARLAKNVIAAGHKRPVLAERRKF